MADDGAMHRNGTPSEPQTLSDTQTHDMDEVGYLFLEQGEAKIVLEGADNVLPTKTWIDVKWEASDSQQASVDSKPPLATESLEGLDGKNNQEKVCFRCNLVLHSVQKNESEDGTAANTLIIKNPPLFDGTMHDMACQSSTCSCTHAESRSDAALLAGVAFTCQLYGYISIQRIQVLLSEVSMDSSYPTAKVSLVVAFSIPSLSNTSHGGKRCILPSNRKPTRKKTTSTKPLPPSMQLLLSIARSDWNFLNQQMETLPQKQQIDEPYFVHQMQHDGSLIKTKRTMFPPKLSLEELYLRLRGVTTSELDATNTETSPSLLVSLPKDVIVTSIAPFLHARSLDSLRRSCKLFHYVLRKTVPGLKLRLYSHQVRSLEWMRRRETQELSEQEILDVTSHTFGSECVKGDMHRAVTGGATSLLCSRRSGETIRVDQQTGLEIPFQANTSNALSRRIARGGLLCDDPGLGKTITVMSLILQTNGLSTEPQEEETPKVSHTDEDIFQAYWTDHVPYAPFRRAGFIRCLKDLRWHAEARMFEFPVDPVRDCCPDYYDVVDRPISLSEIEETLNEEYCFQDFEADVNRCFQNAIDYNPPGHLVHDAAVKLSKVFAETVNRFKEEQVTTAKKSFAKASAKPNSSVAALLEKRHRDELLGSLKPSSANLLVVPGTLLNHWEEQLKMHTDWSYMTDKVPLIYHYIGKGRRDEEIVKLCKEDNTHSPLVFIDRAGTKPLPSADFLAMFRIVITTTQRLTNEWKHGSYEEELHQDNGRKKYSELYEVYGSDSRSSCTLLKVHWFRLVVDEGHSMGRGSSNSAISFASWIQAERKWAMTGTPTPNTAASSGLTNLLGLMRFLQHDFFSPRLEGDKVWKGSIVRSWNSGSVAAFFRLHSLMALLMVRHTKLDIDELPLPKFCTTKLDMSKDEIASYNVLVSGIMSNLKITSMEGLTSGRQDSLLFPSQSRNARTAFTNVRLVCSGRNGLYPTIADKYYRELIDMLKELGLKGVRFKLVQNFLHRVVTEQMSSCNVCGLQLHTLLLVPCGHMVCVDCFDSKITSCAVCNEAFDVDAFQKLQPGIELQWHSPEHINKKKAAEASADTSPVIESPNMPEAIGVSDRVALQPAAPRRRTRRPRDGHECEFDIASSDGKCTLCLEEHFDCVLFDQSRCSVCYKRPAACPDYETKAFYLANKLQELHLSYPRSVAASPTARRPLKAIVFSEFRSTLNLVGDRLIGQFGGGCVAEYWGTTRDQELQKFAKSSDCFCMLLGRTGSEGLDLSFVTHIFMLEKVFDKSLENQTISRAWRMGAKGHVEVETLIARDSMEENMIGMDVNLRRTTQSRVTSAAWQDKESSSTKEYQRAKLLYLLQNLKLIRSQPVSKKRARAVASASSTVSTNDDSEAPKKKTARVRFQD